MHGDFSISVLQEQKGENLVTLGSKINSKKHSLENILKTVKASHFLKFKFKTRV